jgi:hypothetical protein
LAIETSPAHWPANAVPPHAIDMTNRLEDETLRSVRMNHPEARACWPLFDKATLHIPARRPRCESPGNDYYRSMLAAIEADALGGAIVYARAGARRA